MESSDSTCVQNFFLFFSHVAVNQIARTPALLSLHPQFSPCDSLLRSFQIANSLRQPLQSSQPSISRSQLAPLWEWVHTPNLTIKTMTISWTVLFKLKESFNVDSNKAMSKQTLPPRGVRPGVTNPMPVGTRLPVGSFSVACWTCSKNSPLKWYLKLGQRLMPLTLVQKVISLNPGEPLGKAAHED